MASFPGPPGGPGNGPSIVLMTNPGLAPSGGIRANPFLRHEVMAETVLQVKSVTKHFPGVVALNQVDFNNYAGEIHALVGENGAGKSTLIKVIAGAYQPDGGEIIFGGQKTVWDSPHQSREAGISVIYQEFNLFPDLTVAENIFMGNEPLKAFRLIDYPKMIKESDELLSKFGICIEPLKKVKDLSVAEQQMVEIAKGMCNQTKLFILDEPTAGISDQEAETLFERLAVLKAEGVSVIYISHRLGEIFQIADRVTVLKDGNLVDTFDTKAIDKNTLVSKMVGRDLEDIYPPKGGEAGGEALSIKSLSVGHLVKDVSFSLRQGEILGLAGLVGSRRTELAHGLFGSLPITAGSYKLGGREVSATNPQASIRSGLGFLTEDRKNEGLVLGQSIEANITMPILAQFANNSLVDFKREKNFCQQEMDKYAIVAKSGEVLVNNLSGGNQQKVLFSRWVQACGGVLILDEPTRGVDVGAKVEIYKIIRDLAESGLAILLISSELQEVVGMCDRVVVMKEGRLAGELENDQISEESIMHLATLSRENFVCD